MNRDDAFTLAADLNAIEDEGRRASEERKPALRSLYRSVRAELRAIQERLPACRTCSGPAGECSLQCPNHPGCYTADAERDDSLYQDSLGYDAWFSMAVRQYDAVHGEGAYCS